MSKNGKIFIEADEMWTSVGSKENDIWIWLAVERRTELLLVLTSEKETMPEPKPCGTPFLKTAKGTEYFSRTVWLLMEKHFRRTGTESSAKEAEK